MGKLWVRVALLSTFSIVLTALLVMLIQNFYEARAFQNLNPALRDVTETLQAQPDLTEAQQLELFRTALRRTADSDAEVRQFGQLLRDRLTAQRRIPRLAALLSLPVAVLVSAVLAWFIARPIRNVTRAATRVAHGDLSARAPLPSELQAGSELAKLSHNFNAMAETLQRLDSERKNMVADVAHELRTPLTILQGQIDALREGVRPLNDAALAKLDRQTQLLSRLVQDLRTLSAAEAEGLPLELHTLDIVRFSKGVVSRFEDKANAKGQDLSFHAKLRQNVFVKADPDRLEQVLGNLLENAVRYTPEGGAVDVSRRAAGEQRSNRGQRFGTRAARGSASVRVRPFLPGGLEPGSCLRGQWLRLSNKQGTRHPARRLHRGSKPSERRRDVSGSPTVALRQQDVRGRSPYSLDPSGESAAELVLPPPVQ